MGTENSAGGMQEFVFTREFAAPRELVFAAWTDPKHLAQWWGPQGFTNPVCRFVAKPGGEIYIDMQGPDGTVYPMTGEVREVTPPGLLVFSSAALSDEGNIELEVLNTVTFEDKGGKTLLKVTAQVISATELGKMYLSGMEAGWSQSFEKLAAYLLNTSASS